MRNRQSTQPKVPRIEMASRPAYRRIGVVHFSDRDSAVYIKDTRELSRVDKVGGFLPRPRTNAATNGKLTASHVQTSACACSFGISPSYSAKPIHALIAPTTPSHRIAE